MRRNLATIALIGLAACHKPAQTTASLSPEQADLVKHVAAVKVAVQTAVGSTSDMHPDEVSVGSSGHICGRIGWRDGQGEAKRRSFVELSEWTGGQPQVVVQSDELSEDDALRCLKLRRHPQEFRGGRSGGSRVNSGYIQEYSRLQCVRLEAEFWDNYDRYCSDPRPYEAMLPEAPAREVTRRPFHRL